MRLDSEPVQATPGRMARAYAELFTPARVRSDHLPERGGQPKAVDVVIEAEHTCMTLRGVRAVGTTSVTSTLLGTLHADARSRQDLVGIGP
ncbi:GTP cyclohydrolase I [Nocardia grenadensis]